MLKMQRSLSQSRRAVLAGGTALALFGGAGALRARNGRPIRRFQLVAAPATQPLVGAAHPETPLWAYNGSVPGPVLRARQGERLEVLVENRLSEPTTVHWHGLRVPNAMDGVPHLTQPPIAPGGTFNYAFDLDDAGTFWYHPHHNSAEQVGRGLAGALIVEEAMPLAVDRELVWVLGDWRLTEQAAIRADFGNLFDMTHAGRLGNTVTINGRVPEAIALRSGERVRLRLINAANARIFRLAFGALGPLVVALDGQPVVPYSPDDGKIVLGPGMRTDLVLDCMGAPGERLALIDDFFPRQTYRLAEFAYAPDAPLRAVKPPAPAPLPRNPIAEPDFAGAERHRIEFGGGAMGRLREAELNGERKDMRDIVRSGHAWAINGKVATGHSHAPLFTVARGRSVLLELINDTAWPHPIHLHGHIFRIVSRNGAPSPRLEWRDTMLLMPQERAEIAFAADNPGDWMLHCHILEHQAGGMMATLRVA